MSRFRTIFPNGKPLIAMAHVPALPGTPLYDADAGLPGAIAESSSTLPSGPGW